MNNTIKIWDNHNKQWLEPVSIIFGKKGEITKVSACAVNEKDVLKNGWYNIEGKDLKKIAITGSINLNEKLIPKEQ